MPRWNRSVPGAPGVFHLPIALEAVIMISPFTAYFYTIYWAVQWVLRPLAPSSGSA